VAGSQNRSYKKLFFILVMHFAVVGRLRRSSCFAKMQNDVTSQAWQKQRKNK
jgi:hypothetical protein